MATEDTIVPIDSALEPVPDAPAEESEPAPEKATKSKKSEEPKPKKASGPRTRNPPNHPPYEEMTKDAIVSLKEKSGSSQYAIARFIEEKHKQLPPNFKKLLLFHLKKLVSSGKLVKVKCSFKLPPARSAPGAKPSVPAKKKPVAKALASKKPDAKGKAKAAPPKAKSVVKSKTAATTKSKTAAGKPKASTAAKSKTAPKPRAKERPAKALRTSTRTSPGKKPAAKPAPKKAAAAAMKVPAKSVKPKSVKSSAKKSPAKRTRK